MRILQPRIVVCALFLLLTLAAAGGFFLFSRSSITKGESFFTSAYRRQRPLRAQISGLPYAPYISDETSREIEDRPKTLDQAEAAFLEADRVTPGPRASHALGRYYLSQKSFKRAIDQFSRALQSTPNNPLLLNDLGAALMEDSKISAVHAKSGQYIEQLAIALEHFDRALKLDPNALEPAFNRAQVYEQLMLPHLAEEQWRAYLNKSGNCPWESEARQSLNRLARVQQQSSQSPSQLVGNVKQAFERNDETLAWNLIGYNRNRLGSVVVQELLDRYLSSLNNPNVSETALIRSNLSAIANLEVKKAGDYFTNDLLDYYDRAASARSEELVRARADLLSGISSLDKGDFEHAKALFSKSLSDFNRIGDSNEAFQAEFLLSRCFRNKSDIKMRQGTYERLSRAFERRRYKHFLTQIITTQAQLEDGLANYSNVIEYTRRGLQISDITNDKATSATLLLQAASAYRYIGDYYKSLKLYYDGLSLVAGAQSTPYIRWAINQGMGLSLNLLGRHFIAADYQKESLRIANEGAVVYQISRSLVNLASTYSFQNNFEKAIQHAKQASELASSLPEGNFRVELRAYTSLELGRLYNQSGDFMNAFDSFDQSIKLYKGLSSQEVFRYSALKGKLISLLAQGGSPDLKDDIDEVVNIFEAYRSRIRQESIRNAFFDQEQSIYDIAINFWHQRHPKSTRAFDLAERSRARSLLDSMSAVGVSPAASIAANEDIEHRQVSPSLTFAQIRSLTPENAQIVQYSMLKDKLLIWVIHKGKSLEVREWNKTEVELTKLSDEYLSLLARGQAEDLPALATASHLLYDSLIAPIADQLDKRKVICFVPDKILHEIPFVALKSSVSGRYLIEDYSIQFSPSATMFVLCSKNAARRKNLKNEKLISVGDPAFDRSVFSPPYLQSAARTAETVAGYYHDPYVLTGERATKPEILKAIDRADVLHLSLHCVVDKLSPMHSKLLFAKSRDDSNDGALLAYEIRNLNLSQLRLVVLAACRSGVERFYGGEGMIGISRSFLATGVPLVIASLWQVDSDSTAELMIRFHQIRKFHKLSTTEALRQTQLEFIRNPDQTYQHPFNWASFESIGGLASF